MPTRFNLKPQQVAKTVSMNADGYSLVTNINSISGVSYTLSWTNGASGNFLVEVCDDYSDGMGLSQTPPQAGSWTSLPLSASIATTGTAGTAFADIVTQAAFIRIHFQKTGGSGGTFSATIAGKVQ